MEYRISQDTWTNLPHCPTTCHSLTTLNDKLVVIGGKISSQATNVVYTFRARDGRWLKDLPPMPTARYSLSTVSHQDRYIIAAGGTTSASMNGENRTRIVEVYVKDDNQWYSTKRLPFPMAALSFSICVVNDICYAMGGKSCIYASLPSRLCDDAVPPDSIPPQITWKTLEDQHPLMCTSPASVDGRLVAFGGYANVRVHYGTRLVSTYNFSKHRWLELADAQLPVPLYRPGVIPLDNDKLMIIGGQPKTQQLTFSTSVFIGSYRWLSAR